MSVDLTPFETTLNYSGQLDTDQVLCLLPVRLETRFVPASQNSLRHLMIRIFPDDVHVDTHNPALTPEEQLIALTYRQRMDAPGTDETMRRALWGQFCGMVGTSRATYLAQLTEAELLNASLDSTWKPPYARGLPTRWVALCYQGGVRVKVIVGNPIDYFAVTNVPDALLIGPNFELNPEQVPENVEELLPGWMLYPDVAESMGMALFMDLTSSPEHDVIWDQGFDQIIVLGLDTSHTASQSSAVLEELLTKHTYVKGLDRVEPHTPTTSTSEQTSSFDRRPIQALYERGVHSPLTSTSPPSGSESQRLADALGLSSTLLPFQVMTGALDERDLLLKHMHTLLWNVGLGYYTEQLLHPLTGWRERRILRSLYLDHVRGDGPLSTLRVGAQPYGVLPTMAHSSYVPFLEENTTTLPDPDTTEFPEHYRSREVIKNWSFLAITEPWSAVDANKVLQALRTHWLNQGLPGVPRIAPGAVDPTGDLVRVIAHHHAPAQIRERAVLGGELYEKLVQEGGWPVSSPVTWQQQQVNAINALLDTLDMRASQTVSVDTPRISGMHPFPVSQELTIDVMELTDASGVVLLSTQSYLNALKSSDPSLLLSLQTWQSTLPGSPAQLPLFAKLAHGALQRALEVTVWSLAGKRGQLTIYPPRTPEFTGLTIGNSPDAVPLEDLLDMTLGTLELDVTTLAESNTLEDAMTLLLTFCMDASNPLEDILFDLFSNEVEAWEISELYDTCQAIAALEMQSSEQLRDFLFEAMSSSTHRLDAWFTGLASQRLFHIRKTKPTGIHLGGYGVLEDVRRDKSLQALGVLHAPSQAQAQTLAVIKSGQMNHEGTERADLLKIDASSKQVRRAIQTLDSMRSGQTLGDVLGRFTEVRLQELANEQSVPDARRLLTPLRRAFPAHMTNESEGVSKPSTADGRAVDGLQLLRAHESTGDVFTTLNNALSAISSEALTITAPEQTILLQVIEELDEHMSALHDVLLTESVHQSAQGNLARAQAALGVLSGESVPMTELESMMTPYEGKRLTHRLGMLVSSVAPTSYPWAHDGSSPRTQLAPSLTAWIESWIPDPSLYICQVKGHDLSGNPVHFQVSLRQLALSGVDLLAMSTMDSNQAGEGLLEAFIKARLYNQLASLSLTLDVQRPLLVDWVPAPLPKNRRSFKELFALLTIIRRVVSNARPFKARDLVAPGTLLADEHGWDLGALSAKIEDALTVLGGHLDTLTTLLTPASVALDTLNANKDLWGNTLASDLTLGQDVTVLPPRSRFAELGSLMHAADPTFLDTAARDQVRQILESSGYYGVGGVLPVLPRVLDAEDAGALMHAGVMAHRAIQKHLSTITWDSQNPSLETIQTTLESLFGENVLYTPIINAPSALVQAFDAQDALLASDTGRLETWLTQVAQTHPQARNLSDLRIGLASAEVLPSAMEGAELVVAQLPYQAGDGWLGDSSGTGQEQAQALSMVCWADEPTRQATSLTQVSGLFLEDWVEFIPDAVHTTGAAIHAESPKAKAPQAILLAVPEELGEPWTLDRVERTLLDTLDLAKMRGVDPECLGSLSHLLPTLYLPFTTITDDVPTDPA